MMAMVGSFLGVKLTFFTIMFGSMLGTVFGIVAILQQQKDLRYELPFGTFLGSAALVLALFGGPILQFMFP
jgi:prepilin signal peptidase PulO-like enzyme (type II secretory pathway)